MPRFIVLLSLVAATCAPPGEEASPSADFRVLQGEYLGQEPPGMEAELFASHILSTGMSELNSNFFPGGKEVIFSVTVGPMKWALIMMKEENGQGDV